MLSAHIDRVHVGVGFRWLPRVIRGTSFQRCIFQGGYVRAPKNPAKRFTFESAVLKDCEHNGCFVRGAVLQNCEVSGLRHAGRLPSFLWGCLYSNVTVVGEINGLLVRHAVNASDKALSAKYSAHAALFYRDVKVALDVSQARFSTVEALYGIPPELIIRNPETQFILRREMVDKLLETNGSAPVLKVIAEQLAASPLKSVLLVLGHSDSDFDQQVEFAHSLRATGLLA